MAYIELKDDSQVEEKTEGGGRLNTNEQWMTMLQWKEERKFREQE